MIKLLFKPVDLIAGMVGGCGGGGVLIDAAVAERQPGEFARAIWVPDGEVERLSPKWKRGFGRLNPTASDVEPSANDLQALAILIVKLLRCC